MTTHIESKLPDVGTTIFTVMSKMAQDYGAINLSQGFPDFEPDEGLLERVNHHLHNGKNQYPPMMGVPELRRAISEKLQSASHITVNRKQKLPSPAVLPRLCIVQFTPWCIAAMKLLYSTHVMTLMSQPLLLSWGKTVHIPMIVPDYRIDWDAFQQKLNSNTRMVIINSPTIQAAVF